MRKPIASSLRRALSEESGIVLVAAIGIAVVLGATVTTTIAYTSSAARHSNRSAADQVALSLAEAGMNNALSQLYAAGNPNMSSALPAAAAPTSEAYVGGTVEWYGALADKVWTVAGVGRVANPTPGLPEIVRRVRTRVRLGSSTRGSASNAVWNYVYSDDTSRCMTLANSVEVNVPLYVKGDLCLENSARFIGYALQVGGTLTLANSSQVGTTDPSASSSNPKKPQVHEVHVRGGCRADGGPLMTPCGPAQRVYSELAPDDRVGDLHKPPVNLAYWYEHAAPGPRRGCTTGSFPGGFDNDSVMNRSLTKAVNLAPSQAYDCRVLDAAGNLVGRIAWTPGGPGTLLVEGTIFFDGDIEFTNSTSVVYQGRATIYASGRITMRNSTKVCGVAGCGDDWDASQNLLVLVAGSSTDEVGMELENSTVFQGASYAVTDFREQNSVTVWGPIIARFVHLQNSTKNRYVPIGTLLPGMPAEYEEVVTLIREPGSWGF